MFTHLTTSTPIRYVPECSSESIDGVLGILDRWHRESYEPERRKSLRFPYGGCVLAIAEVNLDSSDALTTILFPLRARNLSAGGISLLAPPIYLPEPVSLKVPRLHAERLVPEGRTIAVGLPRHGGQFLWMRGEIVRSRLVQFGFRECGITFIAKEGIGTESGPVNGPAKGR